MKTTRRAFLVQGALGAGLWRLGGTPASQALLGLGSRQAGKGPILVVLQLSGGNDGLNTVVPVAMPDYARLRGRLAIAASAAKPLDKRFGLHPALAGTAELYAAGRLAIVQGVGYPNPNRSHFKSMDIWHAGDPTGRDLRFGWLGRALDHQAAPQPLAELGVNLASTVPLALNGARYKPVSFEDPNAYRFAGASDVSEAFEAMARDAPMDEAGGVVGRLRRTAGEAVATSSAVRSKALAYKTPVDYGRGGRLGGALRLVAGLIAGGLGTRVYYTYHGGFDTHTNQEGRHATLLQQLDQALVAFHKDLERQGLADRVVLMAFSEFGRRVAPNASGGTDHGTAGPVFLLGSRVRGGLHGEHPSLADLDRGDLRHGVDFRRVYATLLRDVLEVDPSQVLRGQTEPMDLLS